jgi:ubiquinone/menaquinone biosynthesis C-methylase UbiE
VEMAQERAREAWIGHATFREGDLLALEEDAPFDAVVGRFVLMYLAEPIAALQAILRYLRPNGIVAFQEGDFTFTPMAVPSSPLYERTIGWIRDLSKRAGAEMQMGFKLYQTYVAAGLPEPRLRMDTVVGGGPNFEGYEYLAELVRSILLPMEQFGVATAAEVEIDTLADRLRDEVVRGGGCITLQPLIGGWTRKL